jgi:hypothetical protein
VAKSKPIESVKPQRVRTPDMVAQAAIERFSRNTAQGENIDSDAWKKAIEDEARIFAGELIRAAAMVAGGKRGSAVINALAEAAG